MDTDNLPTEEEIDEMLAGYLEAGLWATTSWIPEAEGMKDDEHDTPMDDLYTPNDCENPEDARADCEAFAENNIEVLRHIIEEHGADWSSIGHDFLLTRDGHGAGFWDRGYGKAGTRLSVAARVYSDSGFQSVDVGTFRVGE